MRRTTEPTYKEMWRGLRATIDREQSDLRKGLYLYAKKPRAAKSPAGKKAAQRREVK